MARVGISAMYAIPVDGDVGSQGLWRDQELMRQAFEDVENIRRRVVIGVEEEHFAAHFVDRN
jgi:hypothetical protein